MSLINALNIGKSALTVHQAAIQVTSNNVANAGNPDYTRQVARISPSPDRLVKPGVLMGSGVRLDSIQRQIDDALEGRLRGSVSDSESAQVRQEWLGRVESIFNALGDENLSTQMGAFFKSWSDLANKPQDLSLRQLVVQAGQDLATSFHSVRGQLSGLETDLGNRLVSLTREANSLAEQVANLNTQIATAEGGGAGSANALRDQRDGALRKLSELIDVKVQDTGNGMVNVLVGSEPLVLGGENRGLAIKADTSSGVLVNKVVIKADNGTININSGQIGGLLSLRTELGDVIGQVDSLAGNLAFELNRVHASGQGMEGMSQATAANAVNDAAAALNTAGAGLEYSPANGSFVVHVKQKTTGLVTSTLIKVDLDGLNGDDTTLNLLAADLDGIAGISASVSGGKLKIQADSSVVEFSFSQDSSGALASLGINTFFTGKDAADINVNAVLKAKPALLAAAGNGQSTDNQTALAIAALATQPLSAFGGASVNDRYESMINGVAMSAAGAKTSAEAALTVTDTLTAQREALSGVSLDEEAINLIREQRAFQGAARIITAVDEMMRTLLQM